MTQSNNPLPSGPMALRVQKSAHSPRKQIEGINPDLKID